MHNIALGCKTHGNVPISFHMLNLDIRSDTTPARSLLSSRVIRDT